MSCLFSIGIQCGEMYSIELWTCNFSTFRCDLCDSSSPQNGLHSKVYQKKQHHNTNNCCKNVQKDIKSGEKVNKITACKLEKIYRLFCACFDPNTVEITLQGHKTAQILYISVLS